MGTNIPFRIRKRVLRQWLEGDSRDQIAKDNDIGQGTVSAIVKEARSEFEQKYYKYNDDDDNDEKDYADGHDDDSSEFELLRQLAVTLKRKRLDVNSFASAVRLLAILEKKGLNEEQIESFVENIDIHCFKHGLKPKEFIDTIDNISFLSSSLAIPVHKLAENITQQQNKLDKIKQEIKLLEQRKADALEDCNVTRDTLNEYKQNSPVFDKLIETKRELKMEKRQKLDLMQRLDGKEFDICMLEFEWSVPEWKFDEVSEKLGRPFDMHELNHITQEIFFNPDEHIDIIRTLEADIGILPQDQSGCEECLHSPHTIPPLLSPSSCSSCSAEEDDLSENRYQN